MNVHSALEWHLLFDHDSDNAFEKKGKFVQVVIGQERMVAFGEIEQYPYHANILAAVLELKGIAGGQWESLPDLYLPPREVKIVGGGWFKFTSSLCLLSGSSRAYGNFDASWFDVTTIPEPLSKLSIRIID